MSCREIAHERLIEGVVTGTLDRRSPELSALEASCAACRARLEDLDVVLERLDAAGREQRRTLADARALRSAPGAERIAETIASLRNVAPRARLRRWISISLAASAIILATIALRTTVRPRPPGQPLGSEGFSELAPSGAVAEYREFTWKFAPADDVRFDLVIFDDRPGSPGAKIVELKGLSTNRWTPTPETLEKLTDAIVWTVRADQGAGIGPQASARCWRLR